MQAGLKTLITFAKTNTSGEARLFPNFWSIAEHPQPGGQSAYRRLKEKRNALTFGRLTKTEHSLSCTQHFFFFALSLLRASTSSPTSVQPEIKKAEADRRACTRKMSLNASHKYLSQVTNTS